MMRNLTRTINKISGLCRQSYETNKDLEMPYFRWSGLAAVIRALCWGMSLNLKIRLLICSRQKYQPCGIAVRIKGNGHIVGAQ